MTDDDRMHSIILLYHVLLNAEPWFHIEESKWSLYYGFLGGLSKTLLKQHHIFPSVSLRLSFDVPLDMICSEGCMVCKFFLKKLIGNST